ncbi:hypothetical protein Bca4012_010702 [Brassica carinata]|uniref:Uncharacterized protein n=1 Tax=Brassica carinata TaxID=52824 RepID=A0A8X7S3R4_BRACI|nr:hypothetical protein Bca52824_035614 [Brassica carinata]
MGITKEKKKKSSNFNLAEQEHRKREIRELPLNLLEEVTDTEWLLLKVTTFGHNSIEILYLVISLISLPVTATYLPLGPKRFPSPLRLVKQLSPNLLGLSLNMERSNIKEEIILHVVSWFTDEVVDQEENR